ncbi:MAG: ATP synthase subunit I [Clostridia bacterium]|nr:ATP synthase subunit I [Clostridia bacterium]
MKLQSASQREVKRIACGTAAGGALLIAALFALSKMGIGEFDYRVITGAIGGCLVAVVNFAMMCLTIQRAVNIGEQKAMKTFIQGSYNGRLLLQAGWIVAAYLMPWFNVFAAAIPLLFPNLMIFYLQARGKLVTPSERRNPPPEEMEELEDHKGSFEV